MARTCNATSQTAPGAGTGGSLRRCVIGMLALAALALLLSQAGRLPGPAGDALRRNAADDRDATALFYTEVDGWAAWPERGRSRSSGHMAAPAVTP